MIDFPSHFPRVGNYLHNSRITLIVSAQSFANSTRYVKVLRECDVCFRTVGVRILTHRWLTRDRCGFLSRVLKRVCVCVRTKIDTNCALQQVGAAKTRPAG